MAIESMSPTRLSDDSPNQPRVRSRTATPARSGSGSGSGSALEAGPCDPSAPDRAGSRAAGAATSTRDRILATAVELITAQGYAGTSIRDIADRLGMTKAALYYHFTAKEDVLRMLIDPVLADLDALLRRISDRHLTGADVLSATLDTLTPHAEIIFGFLHDPSVESVGVRRGTGRRHVNDQLAAALAGPGADRARQIHAVAALGALQAGAEFVTRESRANGTDVRAALGAAAPTVLTAALAALRPTSGGRTESQEPRVSPAGAC